MQNGDVAVWQRMRSHSLVWPKLVWPLVPHRPLHLSLHLSFTTDPGHSLFSVTCLQNEEAFVEHFVYARTRVLKELSSLGQKMES